MTNKKLIHVSICDDDVGEVEGMFDADTEELLGAWCGNDARWRSEYFNGFMGILGFDVGYSEDPKLIKKLKKAFK